MGNSDIKAVLRKAKRLMTSGGAKKEQSQKKAPVSFREYKVDGFTYAIAEGKATLKRATVSGDVVLPGKVDGAVLEAVARGAFEGNQGLVSIEIPRSVSMLGSKAFKDCRNLKKAVLPVTLQVINESTFQGCSSLEEVILPSSLKRLCSNAFDGCSALASMSHHVVAGVSSTPIVTNFMEDHLPVSLNYIGKCAFRGCASLKKAVIPYLVTEIKESAFQGCAALESVTFCNSLQKVDENAFKGAASLKGVRLPGSLEELGKGSFEAGCAVIPSNAEKLVEIARKAGIDFVQKDVGVDLPASSLMKPIVSADGTCERFYTDAQLENAEFAYETRTPVEYAPHNEPLSEVVPSRFTLDEAGIYRSNNQDESGTARIVMVGDLMCRFLQQSSALGEDGSYDFNASFMRVKDVISNSDLAIGNMESMVSDSSPYMSESRYIEDRPHLNAPGAFLSAVRKAGFDAVMNAQNHIYDTGTRGILETLDALNRYQLMHAGVRCGRDDKRFVSVVVNGIHVAILAYMDEARQKMKRINFTEQGRSALFSFFDVDQIKEDVAAARAEGAEFIIAYCHWGREYTTVITQRQEEFAKMVADAGADYIFGSHSHCPQHRTVLMSADGRKVPCIYSGGNFVSDMDIELPVTRDTLISTIELRRDENGAIVLDDEYYRPCRIVPNIQKRGRLIVRLCEDLLKVNDPQARIKAEEAIQRIGLAMGSTYKARVDVKTGAPEPVPFKRDDIVKKYAVSHPAIARIFEDDTRPEDNSYAFDEATGFYGRAKDASVNKAVLCCAGQLSYDVTLEENARFGGEYQFRPAFSGMPACVNGCDLVVGNLNTVCADMYPSTGDIETRYNRDAHYCNARREYLDALYYAGFNCLAASNSHNLDCGVEGLLATCDAVEENGMVVSGIGLNKAPIFDINGIRVSVLSYATECAKVTNVITEEGAQTLLSVYSPKEAEKDIAAVKARGAEFVLVYLNCGNDEKAPDLAGRQEAAKQIAEAGADYVVCVRPNVLSKVATVTTKDGRNVRIATSLGTYMAGKINDKHDTTALIKVILHKDENGVIDVDDNFIPMKRFAFLKGIPNLTAAAFKQFNKGYTKEDFPGVRTSVTKKLGDGIKMNRERLVRVNSHYVNQLTPKQISEILGVEFSAEDRKKLGSAYNKPVPRIVVRRGDLAPGCVAVLQRLFTYKKDKDQLTAAVAKEAGALFVIATEKSPHLPTLVVDSPVDAFTDLVKNIRNRYNPITVGITGTVGKTTTKELMYRAFKEHYETLCVEGNNNTILTAGLVVQKMTDRDEAYVQEVHGGTIGACKRVSDTIKPNIGVVTAIGEGHLGQMGSMEKVIEEKMSIISGMPEGGALIINDDNKYLHEQHPNVRTIRYSMSNPECDYYAQNIDNQGDRVLFQICCKEGVYDAVLNFQGVHNVWNALAVFAAGRDAGIPAHKIIAGMATYVPEGERQNLMEINGYRIIVDSYSSTPLSVNTAIDTLCALPVEEGSRRIAVVGDIPDQGDDSVVNHRNVGETIGEKDFDLLLCCGEDSKYIVEGAKAKGKEAYYFEGRETFNRKILEFIRPGDVVLFKAGTRVHLKEETIIPLFGDVTDKRYVRKAH